MSLKVAELQTLGVSTKSVQVVIKDHLNIIDTKIREADRVFGWNVITYDLPADFAIPSMGKPEQQRFVYSNIISSLRERGFKVAIVLGSSMARLFIGYIVEFSREEVEAMTKTIQSCLIHNQADIDRFCNPPVQKASKAASGNKKSKGSKNAKESEAADDSKSSAEQLEKDLFAVQENLSSWAEPPATAADPPPTSA